MANVFIFGCALVELFGYSISCLGKISWAPLAYLFSMINLHLRASSHELPSPTRVSKSQPGSKVPTFEHEKIIQTIHIQIIQTLNFIKLGFWLIYAQMFASLGLRVGSSFLLDPTLNTSPKTHVQNIGVMSYKLGFRTPCEVVSPNFHALNGWDCMEHVSWDLWVGTHVNRPRIYILDVLTLLLWDKARNSYKSSFLFYYILEDFGITKLHYGFTFPTLRWVHVKL